MLHGGNLVLSKLIDFNYDFFSSNPRKKLPHRRHTSIVRFCGFLFFPKNQFCSKGY